MELSEEIIKQISDDYQNGVSIRSLSEKYRVSPHKINKVLGMNKIPKRSRLESIKINHPWKKKSKLVSVPCEKLKEFLIQFGLDIIEEYNNFERKFKIDIYLPKFNIGIEVNGNQHYNLDGTLKEYYKNRHEYITSHGIELIELHYLVCFDQCKVSDIINNLLQNRPIFDYDYDKMVFDNINRKKKKYLCVCGNKIRKDTKSKTCVECSRIKRRVVERPPIEQLLIEIQESSYVAVGKKYGVSDTAVRKWIKQK